LSVPPNVPAHQDVRTETAYPSPAPEPAQPSRSETELSRPASPSHSSGTSGSIADPSFRADAEELPVAKHDAPASGSLSAAPQAGSGAPAAGTADRPEPRQEIPLTAEFTPRVVDASQLRWLFIPGEDNASEYYWDFGDGHTSREMAGAHSFGEEGEYTVTLTVRSHEGQTRTDTQAIRVIRPGALHPVNIFTPNGDSRNDVFDPLAGAVNVDRLLEWRIYDYSGRQVFASDSRFVWDGSTPEGQTGAPGNYRYVIRAVDTHGEVFEKTGVIRLAR
jgi:hypothetical protein